MVTGPATHRRIRLGWTLRDTRISLGMTQQQVSVAVGRTQGWVNKIETAKIARITMKDLDCLMEVLQIEGDSASQLRDWARAPFDKTGVWIDTNSTSPWWHTYHEIETKASVIKVSQLKAHDCLIHSIPYMSRQFQLAGFTDIQSMVDERLARQQAVLDQKSPPMCMFLLDEACLRTDMDDPATMLAQVEHLLMLGARENITILVVPFSARVPPLTYGFTLIQFSNSVMNDFISVEYEVGAATIDNEATFRLFQNRWEVLRGAALGEYDTRLFLKTVADEYRIRVGKSSR